MRGRRLYKFFDERRWAEVMMAGSMRFRTLAFYRDYEHEQVRGDNNESISVFRPEGGLEITNYTQRNRSVRPDDAFESEAKAGEIFAFCMSKSDTPRMRREFRAVACVEITDVAEFCRRVQKALPATASFGGRPGHERIGHHVQYYKPSKPPEARWACPDLIASSKFDCYDWQDEFRLLFSLTDALAFENVKLKLVQGPAKRVPNPAGHHWHDVAVQPLYDIAVPHDLSIPLSA